MSQKPLLYFLISLSLALGSCQKEDILASEDYKTLGSSAHSLLSASAYSSLDIQISYMPGYAPDSGSIGKLTAFLNAYINKPSGIRVSVKPIPGSGKTVLTLSDIVKLEKQVRSVFSGSAALAVHILIADADYNVPDILATSYWSTSICVFGKTAFAASRSAGQMAVDDLITTLFEHEFGHLLGLVNQGSPMQVNHRDLANGAHCDNRACLMYNTIENTGTGMYAVIPTFDDNCRSDLKANGGK